MSRYRRIPVPGCTIRKSVVRKGEKKQTEGIIEYVAERGAFSFSEVPFGPADSLIFTVLSYLTPEIVVPDFAGRRGIHPVAFCTGDHRCGQCVRAGGSDRQ